MECPACAQHNRDSARFCDGCGAPLIRVCPGCGVEARPSARFCDACGQPLERRPAVSSAEPTPAGVPSAGTSLGSLSAGRYLIERLLGEGSKKRVYLARDTRLGREVAIGLIKTDGLDEVG